MTKNDVYADIDFGNLDFTEFLLEHVETKPATDSLEKYRGKTLEEIIETNPAGEWQEWDVKNVIAQGYWAQANNDVVLLLKLLDMPPEVATAEFHLQPREILSALNGERELHNEVRYAMAVTIENNLIADSRAGMPVDDSPRIPKPWDSSEVKWAYYAEVSKSNCESAYWSTRGQRYPERKNRRNNDDVQKFQGKTLEEVIEINPAGHWKKWDDDNVIAQAYWALANNDLPLLLKLLDMTPEQASKKYRLKPGLLISGLKGETELPVETRLEMVGDIESQQIDTILRRPW